jgi:hypothetical protein
MKGGNEIDKRGDTEKVSGSKWLGEEVMEEVLISS